MCHVLLCHVFVSLKYVSQKKSCDLFRTHCIQTPPSNTNIKLTATHWLSSPPPPTPVPSLPNRPAAFSFGFNQALASVPTLQAGRDRSSRRKVQKKKRSLPMPTSPVTTTAHGSFFSESQDDEQEKQEMVVVATQFGAGKVLHYVRNGTCQVIELPWRLAGGAHAVLYRPM